jgi:hypothetical protein
MSQEEYDKLTVEDIFFMKPSLSHMYDVVDKLGPEGKEAFKKAFLKRMGREGLIGKNMRRFASE